MSAVNGPSGLTWTPAGNPSVPSSPIVKGASRGTIPSGSRMTTFWRRTVSSVKVGLEPPRELSRERPCRIDEAVRYDVDLPVRSAPP